MAAATPAHADLAAIYLQGNGGLSSGRVHDLPAASTSPDHGMAFGAQVGARLLFGEAYIDHAAFTTGGAATRYVLGARAGVGVGDMKLFARAGAGYLSERGGALAGGMEPMTTNDRYGVLARAGGGIESGVSAGLYIGGALEAEYFRASPRGASLLGDESRRGNDMFGYLYLKLQIGL